MIMKKHGDINRLQITEAILKLKRRISPSINKTPELHGHKNDS